MFLTYDEYREFGFNRIDEADFPRLEMLAEDYIDEHTFGQAKLGTLFDKQLKKATALIAEHIAGDESSGLYSAANGTPGPIAGESKDGWSVNYATPSLDVALKMSEQQKKTLLNRYLLRTGWLYAGISTCQKATIIPTIGDTRIN